MDCDLDENINLLKNIDAEVEKMNIVEKMNKVEKMDEIDYIQ